MTTVWVDETRSRIVPADSEDAEFRIPVDEAIRRGLLPPEAKQAPKPADKALRKRQDK